ncbi:hypothetical protein FRUB_00311 [Fimbriiglobus ruber]|uniref:Prohead serine protease domain-containing protein n=1 Tax=Fimbriiglobus ruber TaxID=1908690 RepID=A0A225DZ85_9BACT|nr:hypothetical protein FRUB_00311 [Fimbriiglobus ruber]
MRPCGLCKWTRPDASGLFAKTFFPPRPNEYQGEWLPDFVFGLVAASVLKGFSIGFLPVEIRDPTPEEVTKFPDLQRVITKSLLLEYSVVAVPANPLALVDVVGKGQSLGGWNWETVRKAKPAPVVKTPAPKPEPVAPAVWEFDIDLIASEAVKNLLRRHQA